jgi:hypothetical protein
LHILTRVWCLARADISTRTDQGIGLEIKSEWDVNYNVFLLIHFSAPYDFDLSDDKKMECVFLYG